VSPDLILSLVFAMLILASAFSYSSWRRILREPVELKPAPFTQPLGIEPADPMVLCPACRCMGHHSLELVPAKPPTPIKVIEHPDGTVDEFFTWQGAAGTAEYYRRECVFCGHTWSVRS